jgi:hypothetical protein
VIGQRDERPHEPGDESAWSESYYFAWFSPERSGATRIGNRPNEGTQDVLVVTWDADGAITVARSKRDEPTNSDRLEVGGVTYACEAPLERWRLTCDADAVRLPNPRLLLGEEGPRPEQTRLTFELAFDACQPAAELNSEGPEETIERVSRIASAHFEQSGTMSGMLDGEPFEGRGYRDKSWGTRDWSAPELWRWFAMPFGDDLAMSVFMASFGGQEVHGGWAWMDGSLHRVGHPVLVDTVFGEDGRTQKGVDLSFSVNGERVELHGDVLNVAHVPYPTGDKTSLLNEGLARWRFGDRETLGIAEYLHQLGEARVP